MARVLTLAFFISGDSGRRMEIGPDGIKKKNPEARLDDENQDLEPPVPGILPVFSRGMVHRGPFFPEP